MKRDQNIEIIKLYVEEIWNKWNFEMIDSIIHEDFIDPASKTGAKGTEAFKEVMSDFQTIFPDIHMTLDEIVADKDLVAWKWTATTTYTPKNKRVVLHGIIMDRIDEGKIVERWGYWNESVLNDIPGNDGIQEEE